ALGVDIRLNTLATPELVESLQPDAVIAALGAVPVKLPIPGIDGANAFTGDDAYIHPEKLGDDVVILGAGLVGLELAIYLSMLGKKVRVVEMTDRVNDGGNFQHMKGVKVQLNRYGVEISFLTKAVAIDEKGVTCEKDGEQFHLDCDSVVYAVGRRPLDDEMAALAPCAPDYYPIGDCVVPQNILYATSQAYKVAKAIGRN
ncbi:MAG: FAD-dependent oxidoreductase, partial [Clostridia bacterium]|nr:FAD-dependent oxidoreductase [Clostridia bacterium]